MARRCDISGKSKQKGKNVSHSNVRTNKHWKPNLRKVRVAENGTLKTITVSMKVYKSLKKGKIANVTLANTSIITQEKAE